jgi:regulator of replication initiation timing
MVEQAALTNMLESLVNDNDTLKHDNAELQNLLTESREEIHLLQQEVEERRANSPSRAGGKS